MATTIPQLNFIYISQPWFLTCVCVSEHLRYLSSVLHKLVDDRVSGGAVLLSKSQVNATVPNHYYSEPVIQCTNVQIAPYYSLKLPVTKWSFDLLEVV